MLATPSEELIADAEDLERKKLELQKLGVRRQIEEEMDFLRAREQEEEDTEEQRRTRLNEQRHQQQRDLVQAQEQRRRQRWQSQWIEHALQSMPYDAPEETKLHVHAQVSETLAGLNPSESRQVVRQLVEAATEKALKPWRRQKEIQKIIEDALPFSIKYTDYQPQGTKSCSRSSKPAAFGGNEGRAAICSQGNDRTLCREAGAREAVREDRSALSGPT